MEQIFPKHNRLRKGSKKQSFGKDVRKKCSEKLHSLDMFGEEIKLTYKGRDTFTTFPGSLVSLILVIVVTAITAFKLIDLIYRKNPAINQQV
jgi:hypothetical protein